MELAFEDAHVDAQVKGQLLNQVILVAERLTNDLTSIAAASPVRNAIISTNVEIGGAERITAPAHAQATQQRMISPGWQGHRNRLNDSLDLLSLEVLAEGLLPWDTARGTPVCTFQIVYIFPVA